MNEETKSIKVSCSFCGAPMECPEDKIETVEKHMCFECFQKIGEKEIDNIKDSAAKIHFDIPMEQMDEFIAGKMIDGMLEEIFPKIWKDSKEDIKESSKKEVAQAMFVAGAYHGILTMMNSIKDLEKQEREKSKIKK